jgi:cytochrome c peroxidase
VHSLRDAVRFYVERDTRPEKWFPHGPEGSLRKFDDLPQRYWANLNNEPPFGQKPGDPPRLTESDILDVVAFMQTLTDGYAGKP